MDINQILYFIEVCNTGNISKAAEKLHLSQQGLSASIRRLELELGANLFYRKANNIVLTETGHAVLEESKVIASRVNRIHEICSPKKSGKFRIRIAVTESLIVRFPTQLQRLLINGNNDYEVGMVEGYSPECCNRVEDGDCAMGIIYGIPDKKRFDITSLGSVKQVIIVNKSHPLAGCETIPISALDKVPMVLTHKGSYPREKIARLFEENNLTLNVAYECDRPRQTIDIVSNNPLLAARTIAEEITEQDLEKIAVLNLDNESLLLPVSLITSKGKELNSFERVFRHLVLECYKNQ